MPIILSFSSVVENGWLPITYIILGIKDYAVYRDADGTGTVWTEVNPVASYILS